MSVVAYQRAVPLWWRSAADSFFRWRRWNSVSPTDEERSLRKMTPCLAIHLPDGCVEGLQWQHLLVQTPVLRCRDVESRSISFSFSPLLQLKAVALVSALPGTIYL